MLSDAIGVATGLSHSCAETATSTVWCWGRNDRGQLGDGTTTDQLVPVAVSGGAGSDVPASSRVVATGDSHTCAVASDSSVWCWGHNITGQLGDGTTTNATTPSRVY